MPAEASQTEQYPQSHQGKGGRKAQENGQHHNAEHNNAQSGFTDHGLRCLLDVGKAFRPAAGFEGDYTPEDFGNPLQHHQYFGHFFSERG